MLLVFLSWVYFVIVKLPYVFMAWCSKTTLKFLAYIARKFLWMHWVLPKFFFDKVFGFLIIVKAAGFLKSVQPTNILAPHAKLNGFALAESRIHGTHKVVVRTKDSIPPSCLVIALPVADDFSDSVVHSQGCRVKLPKGGSGLLTAKHVWDDLAGVTAFSVMSARASMENTLTHVVVRPSEVKVYLFSAKDDIIILQLPEHYWSAIGARAANIAVPRSIPNSMIATLDVEHGWVVQHTTLDLVKAGTAQCKHYADTSASNSGAPFYANGRHNDVIGVHVAGGAVNQDRLSPAFGYAKFNFATDLIWVHALLAPKTGAVAVQESRDGGPSPGELKRRREAERREQEEYDEEMRKRSREWEFDDDDEQYVYEGKVWSTHIEDANEFVRGKQTIWETPLKSNPWADDESYDYDRKSYITKEVRDSQDPFYAGKGYEGKEESMIQRVKSALGIVPPPTSPATEQEILNGLGEPLAPSQLVSIDSTHGVPISGLTNQLPSPQANKEPVTWPTMQEAFLTQPVSKPESAPLPPPVQISSTMLSKNQRRKLKLLEQQEFASTQPKTSASPSPTILLSSTTEPQKESRSMNGPDVVLMQSARPSSNKSASEKEPTGISSQQSSKSKGKGKTPPQVTKEPVSNTLSQSNLQDEETIRARKEFLWQELERMNRALETISTANSKPSPKSQDNNSGKVSGKPPKGISKADEAVSSTEGASSPSKK